MQDFENRVMLGLLRRLRGLDGIGIMPLSGIRREASLEEKKLAYHRAGYYYIFCIHDNLLFRACKDCRRSASAGRKNWEAFAAKHGIGAQAPEPKLSHLPNTARKEGK